MPQTKVQCHGMMHNTHAIATTHTPLPMIPNAAAHAKGQYLIPTPTPTAMLEAVAHQKKKPAYSAIYW